MCVKQRWIYNKYDGSKHFVKCGHCEACLQEKSIARTNRVRSEFNSGRVCVFATLSYADPYVPYVRKDELFDFYERVDEGDRSPVLNVYRDFHAQNSNHGMIVKKNVDPIREITLDDFSYHGKRWFLDFSGLRDFENLHFVRHGRSSFHYGKIGVLNIQDMKDFYKRVQGWLKYRKYDKRYEIFYVGEYGGDYSRPHFHVLFSIPQGDYELFKQAILACWSFSDHDVLQREVELARDPASYLSSYVNSGEVLPPLLSFAPPFRPRHKYSHGFGMSLGEFTYDAVSEAVERGCLEYDVLTTVQGVTSYHSVPIPRYVINRYFPRFKGFNRLTGDEIFNVLQRPENIARYADKANLTFDDCRKIYRRIYNLKKRLPLDSEQDEYDWICRYVMVHNRYYVDCMKYAYKQVRDMSDWFTFYYNIGDYVYPDIDQDSVLDSPRMVVDGDLRREYYGRVPMDYSKLLKVAPTFSGVVASCGDDSLIHFDVDPNRWKINLRKHNKLISAWNLYKKNKKIVSELFKLKKYG